MAPYPTGFVECDGRDSCCFLFLLLPLYILRRKLFALTSAISLINSVKLSTRPQGGGVFKFCAAKDTANTSVGSIAGSGLGLGLASIGRGDLIDVIGGTTEVEALETDSVNT